VCGGKVALDLIARMFVTLDVNWCHVDVASSLPALSVAKQVTRSEEQSHVDVDTEQAGGASVI